MAYLGHEKGPKLSEILKRYKNELLGLKLSRGPGSYNISEKTIENIIKEEEREAKGQVETALVPFGYKVQKGEFFYRNYDGKTDCGLDLFYKLTKEEKKQLGRKYLKRDEEIFSPAEVKRQNDWLDDIKSRSNFG